jgi:hypothetical protein
VEWFIFDRLDDVCTTARRMECKWIQIRLPIKQRNELGWSGAGGRMRWKIAESSWGSGEIFLGNFDGFGLIDKNLEGNWRNHGENWELYGLHSVDSCRFSREFNSNSLNLRMLKLVSEFPEWIMWSSLQIKQNFDSNLVKFSYKSSNTCTMGLKIRWIHCSMSPKCQFLIENCWLRWILLQFFTRIQQFFEWFCK